MTVIIPGSAYELMLLGPQVIRATGNIAQTGNLNLFTVSGGRIILTSLVGQVTTVIQALTNGTKITSIPTAGSAVDLCGAVDVSGREVGGFMGLGGTSLAAGLQVTNSGATPLTIVSILVAPGNIAMNCAASATGQVQWTMTYYAYDSGATVTAA